MVTATTTAYRAATFGDALRSEWTKIRTVRSTFWALLIAAALGIGLGALISGVSANHYATDPGVRFNWRPVDHSLASLGLAQLAFAVLGVMLVTGEYSSGMIRSSLAAVPRRGRLFAAKATVFAAVALVVGEVISFATFLVGQALISAVSAQAPSASLGQHEVLRAVAGAGLYLAAIGLLGLFLGTMLRHAAAGIGVVVAVLFVLPGIAAALPSSWQHPIEKYWPTNAGQQVAHLVRDSNTLTPWAGFAVMVLFLAVVAVAALAVLERRDA